MIKISLKVIIIFFAVIFLTGCKDDVDELSIDKESITKKSGIIPNRNAVIEISYDIMTTRDFDMPHEKLSKIDLSNLNPKSEKQKVHMELLKNGMINVTIDKLESDEEIIIPHKTLPDDMPQITKTVIRGNIVSFYDKKGRLLNSTHIDLPKSNDIIARIKDLKKGFTQEEINKTIATMQGQFYIGNLNDFIKNVSLHKGVQIINQGDTYVTMRINMMQIDAKSDKDVVLLIDRVRNKLVGNRIYGAHNELQQTTYLGYNNGKQQYLNAIKTEQKIKLPSGKKLTMITNSKIDNFNFKLNIN